MEQKCNHRAANNNNNLFTDNKTAKYEIEKNNVQMQIIFVYKPTS